MAEKFDQHRAVPETPCECGTCGLTFRKVPGQRGRRFAKACPVNKERLRLKACEYSRRQEAKRKASAPARAMVKGRPPSNHRTVKWCWKCGGLGHRRPATGCTKCGLPWCPDSYQTQGGHTIVVAPERT